MNVWIFFTAACQGRETSSAWQRWGSCATWRRWNTTPVACCPTLPVSHAGLVSLMLFSSFMSLFFCSEKSVIAYEVSIKRLWLCVTLIPLNGAARVIMFSVVHFSSTSKDKVPWRSNFDDTQCPNDAKIIVNQTLRKKREKICGCEQNTKSWSLHHWSLVLPGTAAVGWFLIRKLLSVQI